jgi:transcriptional regulator with XRE-family HTH domain
MSRSVEYTQHRQPSPLAVRRLTLGLLQTEVAERAGVGRDYISRLERGEHQPSLAVARALAVALDCHPDDIFPPVGREEVMTAH